MSVFVCAHMFTLIFSSGPRGWIIVRQQHQIVAEKESYENRQAGYIHNKIRVVPDHNKMFMGTNAVWECRIKKNGRTQRNQWLPFIKQMQCTLWLSITSISYIVARLPLTGEQVMTIKSILRAPELKTYPKDQKIKLATKRGRKEQQIQDKNERNRKKRLPDMLISNNIGYNDPIFWHNKRKNVLCFVSLYWRGANKFPTIKMKIIICTLSFYEADNKFNNNKI